MYFTMLFAYYFNPFAHGSGATLGVGGGKALHENNGNAIEICVESGTMEVSEINYDVYNDG